MGEEDRWWRDQVGRPWNSNQIHTVATVSRELLLFLAVATITEYQWCMYTYLSCWTRWHGQRRRRRSISVQYLCECINDSAINRRRLSRRIFCFVDKIRQWHLSGICNWRETAEEVVNVQLGNGMIITVSWMVDLIAILIFRRRRVRISCSYKSPEQ